MDNLLIDFLIRIEQDFKTPLSQKVDLEKYSAKLLNLATNYFCIESNKIIGLVSIYCNNTSHNIAYIPLVAVDKDFRGKGISKSLLFAALDSARRHGFRIVGVHTESDIALRLYQSVGFVIKENGSRKYLELSL